MIASVKCLVSEDACIDLERERERKKKRARKNNVKRCTENHLGKVFVLVYLFFYYFLLFIDTTISSSTKLWFKKYLPHIHLGLHLIM